jgi:hypothetical protein
LALQDGPCKGDLIESATATQATSKHDVEVAKIRYAELMRGRR